VEETSTLEKMEEGKVPSEKEFCFAQTVPLVYDIQHSGNHQFILHDAHHL
jgi:hypothetical protein